MKDTNRPSTSPRKWHIHPAVALWLIAPVFGELFSGSTPLNEYLSPFVIVIFGMLYGSGAILVREAVVRWRKGCPSLLLLGMAYGIYEEGLMVRSFFDPNWVDLGKLGVYGRVAGVNWVWAEHLTIYHAVISIAAAIVFTEMLYPDRRWLSWVGERGLIWNLLAFVATLPIGGLLNPYNAPDIWLGMCWMVIILLVFTARHLPTAKKEGLPSHVSRPRRYGVIAFLGTFLHFFIVYFTAEQNSPHFIVSMFIIALSDLLVLWLILRWSGNGRKWDDRHRFALIIGTLSYFLIFGPITTDGQYPIMYVSNPVFLAILWWFYRKVSQRVTTENESLPNVT